MWNDVIGTQVYVAKTKKNMFYDWQDTRKICNASCAQPLQERNVKWIKPTKRKFKCNIVVSFFQPSNRMRIWVCIMDATCTFVLTITQWFNQICEVHVGEVLGLLSTLE